MLFPRAKGERRLLKSDACTLGRAIALVATLVRHSAQRMVIVSHVVDHHLELPHR